MTNDNDQAVVEICITRITTAIRETGSIEQHSTALVGLWESCLEHNLTPQGENTEDTPHAKIASDITSCILQVYTRTHKTLFCCVVSQTEVLLYLLSEAQIAHTIHTFTHTCQHNIVFGVPNLFGL